MFNPLKKCISALLLVLSLGMYPTVQAGGYIPFQEEPKKDTVPASSIFRKIGDYMDSLRNRKFRDSVLAKITKQDEPAPPPDDRIQRSERAFSRYTGRGIRKIYFKKLKVFGPSDITDTAFTTSMKLIHIANRLHYDSREWVIRQSLFFGEKGIVNPYTLADNERYLRSLQFIQVARIHIVNAMFHPDSVDIMVVTKDVFEYGFSLSRLTTSAFAARVYNNDLFGAGQELRVGALWKNDYNPTWNTEIRYTKYNVSGSFVDVAVGRSTLNNTNPLDTNVYEGAYYISMNRPLYRTTAQLVGGLYFSQNFSINIFNFHDSLYRNYRYSVRDVWTGYNFLNQLGRDGIDRNRPSIAILGRYYHLRFSKRPEQEAYFDDPSYNNRSYWLGQLVVFRQEFFKTHRFFGYGRTEDIPLGYTVSLTGGKENWIGRKRLYLGIEAEKFWSTRRQGLIHTQLGLGNFWQHRTSEDAVIHLGANYYSQLFRFNRTYLRQFSSIDYLCSPNSHFYKPLNVNYERGIWGYKDTRVNGYQRLNVRSETVVYSPWRFYGFKFQFFGSVQASLLSDKDKPVFKSPIYSGFGVGTRIRNENLPLNTFKIAMYYYPAPPTTVKQFFLEITTISDFRFNISSLKAPAFVNFQ